MPSASRAVNRFPKDSRNICDTVSICYHVSSTGNNLVGCGSEGLICNPETGPQRVDVFCGMEQVDLEIRLRKTSPRLPVEPNMREVMAVLERIDSRYSLMAKIQYGAGCGSGNWLLYGIGLSRVFYPGCLYKHSAGIHVVENLITGVAENGPFFQVHFRFSPTDTKA